MSYCTVEEVQMEFKSIDFSEDDSAVQEESVDSFIGQADAEINSTISIRYQTPVTGGADARLLLKQISVWLVSQRIKDIMEVKTVRQETEQDVKIDTAARARALLNRIAKGEVPLIGADLISANAGVTSYASTHNIGRVFKKSEDQW